MSKRFWLLITATIAMAMVIASCAPAATPAPAAPVEPAAPAAPAPTGPCFGAKTGDELSVIYQWSGAEEENINKILKPLLDKCGFKVVAESTRDNAVLDTKVKSTPPDVVFWPTTAPLTLYPTKLVDLSTVNADAANYAAFWKTMGTVGGKWLALPVKADPKTIIWYSPAKFTEYGYTVPATFADLDALVEKMVADGRVPWSMGMESGAATGWTGSDFIQDLLLVQQGPDYVNKIISGEIRYDDAGVQAAYATYNKWASNTKYTVGGADGTINTSFLNAIYKVFQPKPEAMMVKQSGFAGGEVKKQFPTLEYGKDYDFFGFPDAKGLQGGADFLFAFSDKPVVKALLAYLTSAEGAANWAASGFNLSPNSLAAGKYTDVATNKQADILLGAKGFTPDLGDTIPAPFGEAEWAAIIKVVQGGDIATALADVAKVQMSALGK